MQQKSVTSYAQQKQQEKNTLSQYSLITKAQKKITNQSQKEAKASSFENMLKYLKSFKVQKLFQMGRQIYFQNRSRKRNESESVFSLKLFENLQLKEQIEYSNGLQSINETLISQNFQRFLSEFQTQQKCQIEKKLLQSQRIKKLDSFTSQVIIHKVIASKHHQIIRMQIQLLFYKVEICILNQLQNNPSNSVDFISQSGSFGSVYFVNVSQQELAIKSIPILNSLKKQNSEDELEYISNTILAALKQFFFLLLFSELKIAPQVKTIGGFDIIFFQDCIQFATQICQAPQKTKQKFQELSKDLFQMHMLQVVHRDIKNTNILYSPIFKKNVFIDFGCAQALNQFIGERSCCKFAGTPAFCSKQVLLLLKNKYSRADLYYNDLFGLKKYLYTFKQINQKRLQTNGKQSFALRTIQMKHSLYIGNYELLDLLWKKAKIDYADSFDEVQSIIVNFLTEIEPNEFLRIFYWTRISQTARVNLSFLQLQTRFKNKSSEILVNLKLNQLKWIKFENHIFLYKSLAINYGKMRKKEKQIQSIFLSKKLMEKYMKQFSLQFRRFRMEEKQQKLHEYCLIVLHYSNLVQNNYFIKIQDKASACKQALQIINMFDGSEMERLKIVFECPYQFLQPINIFYHYFVFVVLRFLPIKFRSESIIKIISSWCLLGFPTNYDLTGIGFLIHSLINPSLQNQKHEKKPYLQQSTFESQSESSKDLSQKDRIQNIIIFWKTKLTFLIFNNIFYDRTTVKSKITLDQSQRKQFSGAQSSLIGPKDCDENEFFQINFILFDLILANITQLKEKDFLYLIQLLNSQSLLQLQQSSPIIKEWRQLMFIIVCYFCFALKLQISTEILDDIKKQITNAIRDYQNILPFLIFFYFNEFSVSSFDEQLRCVFKRIDQIIGFEQLSLRYQIKLRLRIALNQRDQQQINKIFDFILKRINLGSSMKENILFVTSILTQISFFFSHYFNTLPNLNHESIQILKGCYEMIDFSIMMLQVRIQKNTDSCIFDRLTSSNFDRISQQTIEQELYTIKHIKTFAEAVLEVAFTYRKIYQIIYGDAASYNRNLILNFKSPNAQSCQQNDLNLNIKSHNQDKINFQKDVIIKFAQQHMNFLNSLSCNHKVLEYPSILMKNIYENEKIKNLIIQNRYLRMLFVRDLVYENSYSISIQDRLRIIKDFFGQIDPKRFSNNKEDENLPLFEFALDYLQIQIIKTNFQIQLCQKMIQFFKLAHKKEKIYYIIVKTKLIRVLFNCYIYCKKDLSQIQEFLYNLTLAVTKSPKSHYVQLLRKQFGNLFWCKCDSCFPRDAQQWHPFKLMEFLYRNVKLQKITSNPYLSLVYLYSMKNKKVVKQINRRFIMFILNSISFLNSKAKQIIKAQIYYFVYTTLPLPQFIILFDKDKLNQQFLIRKIPKSKLNDKIYRQFIYYYTQFKKNQQSNWDTLEKLIDKRFIRQKYIQDQRYPTQIKRVFAKKLKRFYEVNQNYKQNKNIAYLSNQEKIYFPLVQKIKISFNNSLESRLFY